MAEEVKIEDCLRTQAQENIDKVARALLDLWPIMKKYEKDEPPKNAAEVLALEVQHQNSGVSQSSAARQVEKVKNDAALAKALADNEQELVNEKRRKELEEDEALAKKLQEELNEEANGAAAI